MVSVRDFLANPLPVLLFAAVLSSSTASRLLSKMHRRPSSTRYALLVAMSHQAAWTHQIHDERPVRLLLLEQGSETLYTLP